MEVVGLCSPVLRCRYKYHFPSRQYYFYKYSNRLKYSTYILYLQEDNLHQTILGKTSIKHHPSYNSYW